MSLFSASNCCLFFSFVHLFFSRFLFFIQRDFQTMSSIRVFLRALYGFQQQPPIVSSPSPPCPLFFSPGVHFLVVEWLGSQRPEFGPSLSLPHLVVGTTKLLTDSFRGAPPSLFLLRSAPCPPFDVDHPPFPNVFEASLRSQTSAFFFSLLFLTSTSPFV